MKYIILIGDGMADDGELTPLMEANIPNINRLAKEGQTGLVNVIPDNMLPGSDVSNMSIMGYNPHLFYTGRGPLEAASIGVDLNPDDVAYRCNFVTIKHNIMEDFTAGHIKTIEAQEMIKLLNKELGTDRIRFYTGKSYRNLMVVKDGPIDFEATPPHDITGKDVREYLPQGQDSQLISDLMEMSKRIFPGKYPSQIWLWGQGRKPVMPSFQSKTGLTGAVITGVDLIMGIGRLIGLETPKVPGATGYYDTDYNAKADEALKVLKEKDFVFIHVEAPDEAGHEGNRPEKIRAIENIDEKILGKLLRELPSIDPEYRILIMPDHPTPLNIMTHTREAVPYVLWGKGIVQDSSERYNERDVNKANYVSEGWTIIDKLLERK
ncbi:MAG: cofactor-independent phosphoglycerate mutase [Candidatus Margulisiibacteriota bacterium]|jgi:2,3-bisphosphoglycerate-independent phosphoglycerate mutase